MEKARPGFDDLMIAMINLENARAVWGADSRQYEACRQLVLDTMESVHFPSKDDVSSPEHNNIEKDFSELTLKESEA